MEDELWADIPEFPRYRISSHGRVLNAMTDRVMRLSRTHAGHVKITLANDGGRLTRSVSVMVAEAFVPVPDHQCNGVMFLNGILTDIYAHNLAWRPIYFTWKYIRQFKKPAPIHYHNLPILNTTTGERFGSVIEAATQDGLLFEDIWLSTYTNKPVYPNGHSFLVD